MGIIAAIASLGVFVIWRPIRERRRRGLSDAKRAAQDDLLALSDRLTDRQADVSIQGNQGAAEEQSAALAAYERGAAALDAATRGKDMGAVSRAIAEGQYHLAYADACAATRTAAVVFLRPAARHVGTRCLLDTFQRPARTHRTGLLRVRVHGRPGHRA